MKGFWWLMPLVLAIIAALALAWWMVDEEPVQNDPLLIMERLNQPRPAPRVVVDDVLADSNTPSEDSDQPAVKLPATHKSQEGADDPKVHNDPEVHKLSRYCRSLLTAVRAEPNNPRRLIDFAYAVDLEGHPDLALDALRKALEISTDFEGRELAQHLVEEYDEAVRHKKAKPIPRGLLDRLAP